MKVRTHYFNPNEAPTHEFLLPLDLDTEHFDLTNRLPDWFKNFEGMNAPQATDFLSDAWPEMVGEGARKFRQALLGRRVESILLHPHEARLAFSRLPGEEGGIWSEDEHCVISIAEPCSIEQLSPEILEHGIAPEIYQVFGDLHDHRFGLSRTLLPRVWDASATGLPVCTDSGRVIYLMNREGTIGELTRHGGDQFVAVFETLDSFLGEFAEHLQFPETGPQPATRFFVSDFLE